MIKKEIVNYIKENYMLKSHNQLSIDLDVSLRTISYVIEKENLPRKINKSIDWNDNKIKLLKENYHRGTKYCSEILNFTEQQIRTKASKLKLKRGYKTNNLLLDLENKYSIYLLGYLWADGSICINNHNKVTQIMISKEDYLNIKYIFDMFGEWNITDMSKYKKKEHYKDLVLIKTTNPDIYDFLKKMDFENKSFVSPQKLLSKISNTHYFWRGFLDGDGCIKFSETKKYYSVVFSSTIDYNWISLSKYCDNFDINFNVYKQILKDGSSSIFCVQRKLDINTLLNNIYKDNFGLERKYNKFIEFKTYYNL